jgi:putative glutamine amidotransferase
VTGAAVRFSPGRIAASAAVKLAGGSPVPLRPGDHLGDAALDGLIVTGGSDISPTAYGSSERPFSPPDTERDAFELEAIEHAATNDMPILGICRGAQLLNVYRGGSLHADIAHLRPDTANNNTVLPRKLVCIEPDSRLAEGVTRTRLMVNSLHHQAVKVLGRNLRIVALDGDQIVQGIESTESGLLLGVQWHPEYLFWQKPQLALFRYLISTARAR